METNAKFLMPPVATHPGSVLKKELKARNIKQKDFAKDIGMPASNLSELIKGKRNVTETIAIKLEERLGIPFQNWMNLQNRYFYILKSRYKSTPATDTDQLENNVQKEYTARILSETRKNAGMTQAELAEKIGKDKSYISKIERGIALPSISTFYQMISAMGRSVQII